MPCGCTSSYLLYPPGSSTSSALLGGPAWLQSGGWHLGGGPRRAAERRTGTGHRQRGPGESSGETKVDHVFKTMTWWSVVVVVVTSYYNITVWLWIQAIASIWVVHGSSFSKG